MSVGRFKQLHPKWQLSLFCLIAVRLSLRDLPITPMLSWA